MYSHRNSILKSISTKNYDVVIIGGGITGAGVFYKCCKAGLKTLIIDKNDFASGTSSRSAKLIHGGLRYLQYFQISLVKEALGEREFLLKRYPHLVRPLSFFMPIYDSWAKKLKISFGLSGYDLLSGNSSVPKHISVSPEIIREVFPMVKTDQLKGGFIYYDAGTNDARLVNEVIMEGVKLGGDALNYFYYKSLTEKNNKVESITGEDSIGNKDYEIKSKYVFSCTGVWTDEVSTITQERKMKPSKGIHIIVKGDKLPQSHVLVLPSVSGDGRFIWCVPWENGMNIIGSTDTDYIGSLDEIRTYPEEVNYLLDAMNAYLKKGNIKETDILSVYAGLRPLIDDQEEGGDSTSRSRDYKIWWEKDNFLFISGGKLTSFLSMADSMLEELNKKQPITVSEELDKEIKIGEDMLSQKYGVHAHLVEKILNEDPENRYFLTDTPYTIGEAKFYIRHQNAIKLDDLFTRRMTISYLMQEWNEDLVMQGQKILSEELNWTEQKAADSLEDYKKKWNIMHKWN